VLADLLAELEPLGLLAGRLSSRWMASVYWLPPNATSRQKIDVPLWRTLMFMTEAPMLTSPTVPSPTV